MNLFSRAASLAGAVLMSAALGIGSASAADVVKVGVIGQFSGPFALFGKQMRNVIDAYVSQHGTKAGSHEIEFIYKDVGGSNPAREKSLAQELIVKDHVSMLTGFFLSSNAAAVVPVINETKTPSVLSVSAQPNLTELSPYFVRSGENIYQPAYAQAEFAADSGKKRAYVAIADYAPGYAVQKAFTKRFEERGGKIVAADRIPLNTVDFSAFAERIANAKPDVVITFLPNGAPAIGFYNALASRGIIKSTMVIGVAEMDDPDLPSFSDNIIGTYSAIFYASTLDNPENKAFKIALAKVAGKDVVAGVNDESAYDGIHLIYHMVAAQGAGSFDPEVAMKSVKGYSWNAPSGPKKIDPKTRDMIHNMYIREVKKVDGKLSNVVIKTYKMMGDPMAK